MSYSVPARATCVELEEKRSRFITYIEPVSSRQAAMDFLAGLRLQYPDASHHCWAYVIGNPDSPTALACSDDGEPSGSAGKPMLQILQYREVGDVMAVVVRYFGGTKLGVGGLVRAYGAAVQLAIEQTTLELQVPTLNLKVVCDYASEANVRHVVQEVEGVIIDCQYSEHVTLLCSVPERAAEALSGSIGNLTQGQAQITVF